MFMEIAAVSCFHSFDEVDGKKFVIAAVGPSETQIMLSVRREITATSSSYLELKLAQQDLCEALREIATRIEASIDGEPQEAWYLPSTEDPLPSAQLRVSALCSHVHGAHEHLRIWSRGGFAGSLIVSPGDGAAIADSLGLKRE